MGVELGWKSVPIPGFAESKLCLHNWLAGRCPSLSCLTCIIDLIESIAEMDWFSGYIYFVIFLAIVGEIAV